MSPNDLCGARWRKSSHSDGQANCVEVAAMAHGSGLVAVRDSKAKSRPGLTVTLNVWQQFIERVAAGQKAAGGG
jgi:Domain of unknown function (DUF397)